MLASLDHLVTVNKLESFHFTNAFYPDRSKRDLILKKGVYPYEYMDFWDCFNETQLKNPVKDLFYSKLNYAGIPDDDYIHAQKAWSTFGCNKTIGDYHDLFNITDVLLLVDMLRISVKRVLHSIK